MSDGAKYAFSNTYLGVDTYLWSVIWAQKDCDIVIKNIENCEIVIWKLLWIVILGWLNCEIVKKAYMNCEIVKWKSLWFVILAYCYKRNCDTFPWFHLSIFVIPIGGHDSWLFVYFQAISKIFGASRLVFWNKALPFSVPYAIYLSAHHALFF